MTHGGLLGVQEAMAAGTVMMGIPLGGDQFENIDMIVKHDLGMRLDLDSITAETFGHALNRTLKNETYRQVFFNFSFLTINNVILIMFFQNIF